MTRPWPPFLSPGWLCAYVVFAALWALLTAIFGMPVVYALGGFGVLACAALYGNGRDYR